MDISTLPNIFGLIVTDVKRFATYGFKCGSIVYCQKSKDNNGNGIKVFLKNGCFVLSKEPIEGFVQVGRVISVINNGRNNFGTQESIC